MKTPTIIGLVALGIVQIQGATWTTSTQMVCVGNDTVYECVDGVRPPNCSYANPPAGTPMCGVWRYTFLDTWRGCPCPPNGTITYNYFVPDYHGGYIQGATINYSSPQGSCFWGYHSSGGREIISAGCAQGPALLMDWNNLPEGTGSGETIHQWPWTVLPLLPDFYNLPEGTGSEPTVQDWK